MSRTNEIKFKYYSSPLARLSDQNASPYDIAFVKTGDGIGEIYTRGMRFAQGVAENNTPAFFMTQDQYSGLDNIDQDAVYVIYEEYDDTSSGEQEQVSWHFGDTMPIILT